MVNDPFIGLQVGNFRIERLLGHGGMARVYLGWDDQLARPVAIKILDEPYREQPAYTERFLREARAMAAWNHPNIMKVHSAGVHQDVTYYVMEYIHGHDLSQVMRQYASQGLLLPYSEVIRIGRAVGSALDYAHQEGIIHRDVKPSNVLMAEDGRVVLTDFGLAMNVAEGTLGEVFGSPQYISPEQARSSAYAVPQSDLYSLGVMLYELLTGQLPYNDPYPATLALKHINDPVPNPLAFNPSLPYGVGGVLQRALSKDPTERPGTGTELMDSLESALHADADVTPATMPLPRTPGLTDPAASAKTRTPAVSQPSSRPPIPPAPPIRRPAAGSRIPGCALLLIVLLVLGGVVAAAIAFNGFPQNPSGDPTTAITDTLPAAVPVSTLTEAPAPEVTATNPPAPTESPTATAPPPTATPTHTTTATTTPTRTATHTPTPEPYLLSLVVRDRNLFLINTGRVNFPLAELVLVSDEDELEGSRWEIDALERDECVALWQSRPEKRAPGNLHCDLVGEPLRIDLPADVWEQPLEIKFRGQPLEDPCRFRDNQCELEIPANWGMDQPYP